jgi:hypothetical protein
MALFSRGRPAPADDPVADLDPPAPEDEAPAADPTICPRCGGKLTNPDGLGWCAGCGYCRSLEEEGQTVAPPPEAAQPKKPSPLGAAEFGEAMRRMPRWAWPLLGGVALVATGSVIADYRLPEECLARALWSAIQMMLSVIGLIAAQLWAVMLVGAREDGLGARDVFLPGRVWRAAFRRLPTTRKPVWLGMWSATALVCGAAVVGGFNYWPEAVKQKRLREVAEALAAGVDPDEPQEPARESKPSAPPPGAAASLTLPPAADRRPVTKCVVIGYQTDGAAVTGLVVAKTDGNNLQLVGVIKGGISPELRQDLLKRLSQRQREFPLIPGLRIIDTHWVNPEVFCDVLVPEDAKPGDGEAPKFKQITD